MKFKTTAKAIRNNGGRILAFGYGDLQNLLRFKTPVAYTSGVYGWNFDVYEVNGYTITTGYRGTVGKSVDHELTRYFENKAKSADDYRKPYEEREAELDHLLRVFLDAAWNNISVREFKERDNNSDSNENAA